LRESSVPKIEIALAAMGDVLRTRREDLGLSQDELGHLAGLHRTYIGSVERGERNVTLGSLITICSALQLQPHELLRRSGM
jgi:transcriptional regulator with XRE-family HTH domain